MLSNKELAEKLQIRPAKTVTQKTIKDKIASRQFIQPEGTTSTICLLTMSNGYVVIGKSACASPKNFDKAMGEKIAYDDAFQQIWALEGYLLREELSKQEEFAETSYQENFDPSLYDQVISLVEHAKQHGSGLFVTSYSKGELRGIGGNATPDEVATMIDAMIEQTGSRQNLAMKSLNRIIGHLEKSAA